MQNIRQISSNLHRAGRTAGLMALFAAGLATALAENGSGGPGLVVQSREAIYSVEDRTPPPNNQVHFPFLHVAESGMWYMTLREGPHVWGFRRFGNPSDPGLRALLTDDRVQTIMSADQGRTWQPWPGLKAENNWIRLFRTRLKDGTLLSHGYVFEDKQLESDGRLTASLILRRSRDDGATWVKTKHVVAHLPFDISGPGTWGHIVALADGRLIVSLYGKPAAPDGKASGYKLGLLESLDQGESWKFSGWLAGNSTTGGAGPTEADIVNLGNGNLYAVFRVEKGAGPTEPEMQFVRSGDHGKTWSEPAATGLERGVSPQLLLLKNGRLIMSYGTRAKDGDAVWIRSSRDLGRSWSEPLLLYRGPGTGYTDIEELAGNRLQVVYDESTFRPSDPSPPRNQIVRLILSAP